MSVASPQNMIEAKVIVPSQPLDNATVFGQYLGQECPSYRNRSPEPSCSSPASLWFQLIAVCRRS